jgi:hypothetical protein
MDLNSALRKELDRLLSGKGAHADFDAAMAELPASLRGVRPEGAQHSAWEILEHLRIAQHDMLEFSRDVKYQSPSWPEEYWPKSPAPVKADDWDNSVKAFKRDLAAMRKLVSDAGAELFTPFAHGDGQTLLREALQMADHNAYHLGELVLLRRLLGAWKGGN